MAELMKQGFPPPFPAEHELGATRFTPLVSMLKNPVGFPPLPPHPPTRFPIMIPMMVAMAFLMEQLDSTIITTLADAEVGYIDP